MSAAAVGAAAPAPLLDRRLIIVTGKGGTGKTTVTAALARAAARAGREVLAVQVAPGDALSEKLDPGGPAADYAGRRVAPGLSLMHIDPYAALAEYLGLQLGVRGLAERVLRNRGFRQLLDAAPGWRELITLGKLWHLEGMQTPAGQPRFDLMVVDAPATGHGVAFLNVPHVVASAVRGGPLRRHARAVEQLLEDPERTLLLPVALAEELPTRETAELVARVGAETGIRIDRVVVNGVLAPPFPPGLEALDEALGRLPPDARFGALPPAGDLAHCARFLGARHRLNGIYSRRLAEQTGLPLVELPYLPGGGDAPGGLDALGRALLGRPA